jgi:hypothetical protein
MDKSYYKNSNNFFISTAKLHEIKRTIFVNTILRDILSNQRIKKLKPFAIGSFILITSKKTTTIVLRII